MSLRDLVSELSPKTRVKRHLRGRKFFTRVQESSFRERVSTEGDREHHYRKEPKRPRELSGTGGSSVPPHNNVQLLAAQQPRVCSLQ